jgi:hypothetical protein
VTWFLVAAVVIAGALAIGAAIARLGREIPRALEALDGFGRELQPALVRVRSASAETRRRAEG